MGESLPRSLVQTEISETWPYNNSECKTFIVPLLYLPLESEAQKIYSLLLYYYTIHQSSDKTNKQSV